MQKSVTTQKQIKSQHKIRTRM